MAAILLSASCRQEYPYDPGVAISFSTGSVKADSPGDELSSMGIYATANYGTLSSELMKDQGVFLGDDGWTYSPIKYWPTSCLVDFLGYSPYGVASLDRTEWPLCSFTCPDDASDDIMVAASYSLTAEGGPVKLVFRHILSRLSIKAAVTGKPRDGAAVRIRSVTISDYCASGSYDCTDRVWTSVSDLTRSFTQEGPFPVDVTRPGIVTSFFLIPGTVPDNATVSLRWEVYSTSTGAATKGGDLEIDVSGKDMRENTSIQFNLNIDASGDIIEFADPAAKQVCLDNWDTDGDGELSLLEAEAITSLGNAFVNNRSVEYFDELRYFTSLISLPGYSNGPFAGMTALKGITLPANVRDPGDWICIRCPSLERISVVEQNQFLTDIDGVLYTKDMKNIYRLPDNYGITSFSVPYGVERVRYGCFSANTALNEIHLPATVRTINGEAFSGKPLERIYVDEDNQWFCDSEGILYNKAVTELWRIPTSWPSNTYDMPSTIRTMMAYCANSISVVRYFNMCDNLEEIRTDALFGASEPGSFTIPASVRSIGSGAFNMCTNTQRIIFIGTDPPTIGNNAFRADYASMRVRNYPLLVPPGTADSYRNAPGWDQVADRVAELEP